MATNDEATPFVHAQNGVFRRLANQRYYLFLRWHAQGKRYYQVADFATVIVGAYSGQCQPSGRHRRTYEETPIETRKSRDMSIFERCRVGSTNVRISDILPRSELDMVGMNAVRPC